MTTVSLSGVWVSLASDLTQTVHLDIYDVQAAQTATGETRKYAGGRYRRFTSAGSQWIVTVGYRYPARTDIVSLRDFVNKTVLYRDLFGRRFWATFDNVDESEPLELGDITKLDASVTFTQITVGEAV